MKFLTNNKGIALITSLMFTLISLTIVMYLMSMITSGIKVSSANKRYRTALEASYGGADLVINEILPEMFKTTISAGLSNPTLSVRATLFGGSSLNFGSSTDACMMDKLTKPSSQWDAACSKTSDPKQSPDFSVRLNSTGDQPFTVYSKIVETICSDTRPYPTGKCTGSDLSGIDYLDGGAGTTGGTPGVSVKPLPAAYIVEVSGERTNNPQEKSNLSLLYAY